MKIGINYDEILFKSILYYGAKFNRNKTHSNMVTRSLKDDDNVETENLVNVLPYNISELIYPNNEDKTRVVITVDIDKSVLINGDFVTYYSFLNIECKNQEILYEFLVNAKNHYIKEVLNKKREKEKVTVYIWDEYWEVLHKYRKRSLDTIYLESCFKDGILNKIEKFLNSEDLYTSFGIPYKLNLLFEGYPGTGKTSFIYSIASKFNLNIAILNFDNTMTDTLFMRAIRRMPENTILILEDIDVLFKERKDHDVNKNLITFSGLLNCLDGIASSYKQMVFMTTNYVCNLDKALIRPGRIDNSYHFGYCKSEQIKEMFLKFFPNKEEIYREFYNLIKSYNFTTALLQKYFFSNIDNVNDIIKNVEELIELSKKNNYSDLNVNMYM